MKVLLLWLLGLGVLAVLFAPVRLYFRYRDGELSVWVKLLWFCRLNLHPTPEKEKKPRGPKKEKRAKKEPEEAPAKAAKAPLERFSEMLDLLSAAGRTLGYILRRLTLRECRVTMLVGEEEAGDTAIKVGQFYAAGYNLYALLCGIIRVKEFKYHITPDYTGPIQKTAADVLLSIRPSTVLMGGLIFLVKWLRLLIKNNLQNKRRKKPDRPLEAPATT